MGSVLSILSSSLLLWPHHLAAGRLETGKLQLRTKLHSYIPTATATPPPPPPPVAKECHGEDVVVYNTSCGNLGPNCTQLVHLPRRAKNKAALACNKECHVY